MTEEKIQNGSYYGVGVRFYENWRNDWSKIYVYKSPDEIEKGQIVLVPVGDFYGVARVVGCKSKYEFEKNKTYKFILSIIKIKKGVE